MLRTALVCAAALTIATAAAAAQRSPPMPLPNPKRVAAAAKPAATARQETARAASPVAAASVLPAAASGAVVASAGAGPAASPQPAESGAVAPSQSLPPLAKPAAAPAGSPESTYLALVDEALKPLRDYTLSVDDATRIRDAAAALKASDLNKARALRDAVADPVGRKLVDWMRLRAGFGDPAEYQRFLADSPDWPDQKLLAQRLEEQLFATGGSTAAIKSALASRPPQTGAGHAALASALLAAGSEAEAKELAVKAWRELRIPATMETGFLERFGRLLSVADHKWRLDRLLIDDVRWTGDRTERAAVARRVIPLLPDAERKAAEARLAVFLKATAATQLMAAIPDPEPKDWGLVFHRIQLLRRANKSEEASRLLLSAPTATDKIVEPDGWWGERRALAYDALKANKIRLAYDLVRQAGDLEVNALKEQSFLAGWLALRKLKDAKAALAHFMVMREKAADGPLSRAKADYWLGRTHQALGDKARARGSFEAAARLVDTFHGQLARLELDPRSEALPAPPPATPTTEAVARFLSLDVVKAAVVARRAGLDRGIQRAFLGQARAIARTEAEWGLFAHLAEVVGDTQMAVRIGKSAIAQGHNLTLYAYPIHPLPQYTPLRTPPETALLLGVARQESEFSTTIVSGAGARGILQVMPITARHVCKDYKIKCEIDRLLTDPAYNTTIASAYIGDRMAEFAGSYVLTLSGYNAGPGRTRQWIREFGDPRDPGVDPIDWIERIPFQETREYVAKVLSNIQVYRARLGQPDRALRLAQDLVRARGQHKSATAAAPADKTDDDPPAPRATTASDG